MAADPNWERLNSSSVLANPKLSGSSGSGPGSASKPPGSFSISIQDPLIHSNSHLPNNRPVLQGQGSSGQISYSQPNSPLSPYNNNNANPNANDQPGGSNGASGSNPPKGKSFPSVSQRPCIVDTNLLIEKRPTAPALWFGDSEGKVMALPICDLQITSHFHVSTAIVRLTIVFQNTSSSTVDALFLLPLKGSVTGAKVKIGADRNMLTAVVPLKDANDLPKKQVNELNIPIIDPYEKYVPDLFRLPLAGIRKKEQVLIDLDYIEPLQFVDGKYTVTFPLTIARELLPLNLPVHEVVRIYSSVYSLLPSLSVSSSTHTLKVMKGEGRLDIVAGPTDDNQDCTSFTLSYSLLSDKILGTCISETANISVIDDEEIMDITLAGGNVTSLVTPEGKEDGNFLLFVTPPNHKNLPDKVFARDVVFLFDRSGSMVGQPFEEAVRGLETALSMLKSEDKFTVVAFDDEMFMWNKFLQPANSENTTLAIEWIKRMPPDRGATDIRTPLTWALQLLNNSNGNNDKNPGEGSANQVTDSLPIVFLLTDGCVEDERPICEYATLNSGLARILTFGIGTFCNWYFLHMLAEIGRGANENAIYREAIYDKVVSLFSKTQAPILSNITLSLKGVDETDMIPNPIPDLFAGSPLMIAGKYRASGHFPSVIIVRGTNPKGDRVEIEIQTIKNPSIPVRKVFLKQRIDSLTARAWLSQDKSLEAQITKLSCDQSMPCAYTTMVAYEVSKSDYEKSKKSKKRMNAKTIAAVAIGGAVVLGAALVVFGDLGASLGNIPIASAFQAVTGCCGGCGGCCSAICNCGSCCSCVATVCEHGIKLLTCCCH